jgi:hypothetical protein
LTLIKFEVTLVREQNLPDSARYRELYCIDSICVLVLAPRRAPLPFPFLKWAHWQPHASTATAFRATISPSSHHLQLQLQAPECQIIFILFTVQYIILAENIKGPLLKPTDFF